MKVVITVPAYNEEESIASVIKDIKKALAGSSYEYKILVVDDGSADKTAKIAKEKGAIVVSNSRNMGLAETFKKEMDY